MPRHRWATTAPFLPLPPTIGAAQGVSDAFPADRVPEVGPARTSTAGGVTGSVAADGAAVLPGLPSRASSARSGHTTRPARRWAAARGASLVFLGLALTLGGGLYLFRTEAASPAATIPLPSDTRQAPGSDPAGSSVEPGNGALPDSPQPRAEAGTPGADADAGGDAYIEAGTPEQPGEAGQSGESITPHTALPPRGGSTTDTGGVFVHLTGAVASPGVREVPQGSRLFEALELAGGATAEADLAAVNLAAVVVDGGQVHVPRKGEAVPPAPPADTGGPNPSGRVPGGSGSTGSGMPAGMVDLNTADAATLEALPRVGPVLAERIIAWRTEHGPFTRAEDLDAVPGIGPALLEALLPLVVVR